LGSSETEYRALALTLLSTIRQAAITSPQQPSRPPTLPPRPPSPPSHAVTATGDSSASHALNGEGCRVGGEATSPPVSGAPTTGSPAALAQVAADPAAPAVPALQQRACSSGGRGTSSVGPTDAGAAAGSATLPSRGVSTPALLQQMWHRSGAAPSATASFAPAGAAPPSRAARSVSLQSPPSRGALPAVPGQTPTAAGHGSTGSLASALRASFGEGLLGGGSGGDTGGAGGMLAGLLKLGRYRSPTPSIQGAAAHDSVGELHGMRLLELRPAPLYWQPLSSHPSLHMCTLLQPPVMMDASARARPTKPRSTVRQVVTLVRPSKPCNAMTFLNRQATSS
jgi:hypothetical protein